MPRNRFSALPTLVLLLGMAACTTTNPAETEGASETEGTTDDPTSTTTGTAGEGNPPPGEAVGSDEPRELAPDVTAQELATLAAEERDFALELFKALPASEGNRAISPTSLRVAFGMLYEGARTVSEAEVADALHFTLAKPRLHAAMNHIDLELAARELPKSGEVEGDDSVQLRLVNQMFGRLDMQWHAPFLDVLAVHYGSAVHALDFRGDPEGSRVAINAWVAGETAGRIDELLPPGSIFSTVTAVLVNALYLKAPWEQPFESVEEGAKFTRNDAGEVEVAMMRGVFDTTSYFKGAGVEAAELPLRGSELSMVFILPEAGTFDAYVEGLDGAGLGEVLAGLSPQNLELGVPRFTFANAFALRKPLQALGMTNSFELGGGDFLGMSNVDMAIHDVYHNTFLGVDEKGVEAAAATAIVLQDTEASGGAEVSFTADRPFLFAIRDRGTDTLLWFGRVLDPSAP
ncbi:serpin B [Nannocystis exedens]|uniref:Serpin B n=1 Tax=Nannocystis exedens TaxID=54 RepID=A0A1I1ZFZ3_9BACT|nr:serpin family protein [Nannocystis exedens]PCC75039.1 serine protease [Nannocystis exedens]SFE29473.1 serpin B [Nannocystis exedens]